MKALPAALAVAAGLVIFGAASPAAAAGNPIDPGDAMYVVNCDDFYADFLLLSVDASTAIATPIGVGEGDDGACAGQPAYNPATGVSYYIRWTEGEDTLASIDVATGVSTIIGEFTYVDGEFPTSTGADSMAIGADGSAYIIVDNTLYDLNLANAEVTDPITMSEDAFYSFAFDTVTGKFYAITWRGEMYELDVTDGTLTSLGTLVFSGDFDFNWTYSLQFDGAGTAWVEVDNSDPGNAGIWSFTLTTLASPVYSGNLDDDPFYSEALLIIPGDPTLAATGVDGTELLPITIAASVLAMAGLVALLLVRRRAA